MSEERRTFDNGHIEGFVARKPELRYTPNGTAVTRFSIPINGRWNPQTQTRNEGTVWVNCVAFGRMAEMIAEDVDKGDLVIATGKFQANQWTTQEGETRTDLEIIISNIAKKLIPAKASPAASSEATYTPEPEGDLPF